MTRLYKSISLVSLVLLVMTVLYCSKLRTALKDETKIWTRTHLVPYNSNSWYDHYLWYDITAHTKIWSTAHYEHRHFPYGGHAIIIMVYHLHNVSLPEMYLQTVSSDKTMSNCLKPKWVHFGKMVKVRLEVDYFYYAVFLLHDITTVPTSVRISNSSNCYVPLTPNMTVHYKINETEIEFATCLHQGFAAKDSRVLEIASWIEIHRAIGIQLITIYDNGLSPGIVRMLREYEKEGFVELIDWKLHNPTKRIGVNGQLCTINDCFYRNLRRSKYIMFVDLDEIIVPHEKTNLKEMMESLSMEGSVTQYRFYNSFWHDIGELVPGGFKYIERSIPIHFRRTYRTKDCPSTIRHKNIIRTKNAVRIGVHHVYKMRRGERRYQVPESVGLMHHYRTPDYAYDEEKIEDDIMSRYIDQVMSRLIMDRQKIMNGSIF